MTTGRSQDRTETTLSGCPVFAVGVVVVLAGVVGSDDADRLVFAIRRILDERRRRCGVPAN